MKLILLAATISLFSINPLSAGGLSDPIVVPVMSPSEVEVTSSSRGGFWLGAFFVLLIIGASGQRCRYADPAALIIDNKPAR